MMAKKRSKGSGRFVALVIMLAAAVALWLMLQRGQETVTTGGGGGQKYQVQKTGAGVIIDFVKAGRDLDTAIMKTVKDSGFKSIADERQSRQVPRQQVEGTIKWENRHITLAIPTEAKVKSFRDTLENTVKKSGGRIIASFEDSIEGQRAIRYDIGFEDTLENEPLVIITHNIWLLIRSDAPVAPPKGDIPNPSKGDTPGKSKQSAVKQLGRLALVIDDFGLTMDGVGDLLVLNQPMTFAVLPYHPYSAAIARQAAAQGKQVILHLPLESTGGERAEQTTISTTMSDEQIKERTGTAIAALPQISGVNNHQGSKATADTRVMKAVLAVMQERGLFFLDSRTSSGSVAYRTAKSIGLPAAENDHFIDNSSDTETIKSELRTAGKMAISHGEAIAIGHNRPHTVAAIREMLPELESMGVKMVFVSELTK
jgi:polysaccharide deacetylase 2 family uncharacterized protein YibQ